MNKLQTQLLSRARSVRIAFFVDLTESSHPILDAIFQYSYSIWGGRFSLIVPCENGEPLTAFLPWLAAFDPDLIYSYVDLSEEKQKDIHECFYPSALERHHAGPDEGRPNYNPHLSFLPLAVDTLLPIAGTSGPIYAHRSIRVVGAMGTAVYDRFLSDSFGLPSPQLRNGIQGVLSEVGSMLLVVADNELQPRQLYIPNSAPTLPDTTSLLIEMATDRRVFGVSHLSAMLTLRLDLRSQRWGGSFNIVIGDTVSDRVLYWNARSLMSPWRDSSDVDLCIPHTRFNDPAFVAALSEFMRRRNYVNGDHDSGPGRATLRSVSLDADMLGDLAEKMRQQPGGVVYDHEQIASVSECVPEIDSLKQRILVMGQHGFRSRDLWQESYSTGSALRLTALEPEHLRYAPTVLLDASSGAWALDLDIERSTDHSPFSNIRHRWRLPRRLRVTTAFLEHYQLSLTYGERVAPRVTASGFLTVFMASNFSLPAIHLPTDQKAIRSGYVLGRDWMPFERFGKANPDMPPQLCYAIAKSDAGHHFWGVYQLFGDINKARSVLLHEFWRKQFESLGATDQRTDIRQQKMQDKLLQRIGSHRLDLTSANHLHTLADIVLQEADSVRNTVPSLEWTKLAEDFQAFTGRFDVANPWHGEAADKEEEGRSREESFRKFVQNLCSRGVLHQGYEHKCDKCKHRGWISISDLKPKIVCEVCRDVSSAPVDRPWRFRLNGFLREALQRHGIGPLFWVLSRYQHRNDSSFWFEGPLNIFFDQAAFDAKKIVTDIDLTMIDNGVVRMCEVKQSGRQFQDPEGLARTIARLRPDIATIAVMEAESPAVRAKFAQFSTVLEGSGVKPELLLLNAEDDFSSDPSF